MARHVAKLAIILVKGKNAFDENAFDLVACRFAPCRRRWRYSFCQFAHPLRVRALLLLGHGTLRSNNASLGDRICSSSRRARVFRRFKSSWKRFSVAGSSRV